jgi:hypothetical protein
MAQRNGKERTGWNRLGSCTTGEQASLARFFSLLDSSLDLKRRRAPDEKKIDLGGGLGPGAAVRQMLGRPGEVWGAESEADKLVVVRMK